ncbi:MULTISPECIES: M56 family metallopeptidase [Niastella]|uniref:TonB-dependent receptor plug domain-containing protein n=1 Tax=Niastella soli TaxID=2821487 RepID=A0ABS3YQQ1_9BACT|nr:M56 family metallopeptidase [Niastella soli]MBO9200195.1 TonB-dependent receptor plug domain-containing protein [Niastella soli]
MTSQTILFYVLKSILISGLFLGYYWIALRNKSFNYYNRFYLLLSMACSFIIPLFNFSWVTIDKEDMPVSAETLRYISLQIPSTHSSTVSWQDFVLYSVIGISLFLLLVLAFNILKVYQLKRRSAVVDMEGVDFVYTNLDNAPFSFLNNLFWKESISLDDDFGQKIFKHELTHIHQKHTLDVLFCQVINSICWMNPFNWLIQRELKAIHEFIADKEAVGNNNVEDFVQLLLQAHYGKHFLNPTHAFYYSSIKRRLVMLTTNNKARYQFLRKALVLPVTFASIFAFSVSATESKATAVQLPEKAVAKNDTTPALTKDARPDIIKVTADTVHIRIEKKSTNGKKNIPDNVLYILNGNPISAEEMSQISPGNIKSIYVLKDKAATDKYGSAGANGVVEIFLK